MAKRIMVEWESNQVIFEGTVYCQSFFNSLEEADSLIKAKNCHTVKEVETKFTVKKEEFCMSWHSAAAWIETTTIQVFDEREDAEELLNKLTAEETSEDISYKITEDLKEHV
jgi:hypothetical protein